MGLGGLGLESLGGLEVESLVSDPSVLEAWGLIHSWALTWDCELLGLTKVDP